MTTTQTRPTRIGEATIAEFAAGLRGTEYVNYLWPRWDGYFWPRFIGLAR